ncbi:Cyclopropane-fatty-acyl-phospholipid synthase [Gossypium australe]|uniref:Cyclopropane-fatty-acyl-phospholipid synthase n=1 Tax=Gossypium australe TaxID=47621 RepID=A0A5B6WPZ9_9ROSI|nr:Cyclopropane-fatty-acyl-phospholipid synthase [Gossypium australe]
MLPWKTFCYPKDMGGIGFRDIRPFNLALLGRQYFPDGNIFHSKKVDKASFTWNSIAAAANILKDGFGWHVGNGNRINIRDDNWGMEGVNSGLLNLDMIDPNDRSVKDLWIKE